VVSQKLRRAEAKLKQIPILKAQVKAQAHTIRKLEKKLKAFDEMVKEKKDLTRQVKRLQEQLADVGKCTEGIYQEGNKRYNTKNET